MGLQVPFCDECLAALLVRADKRTLTRVDPQMCLQVPRLLELSQTFDKWAEEGSFGPSGALRLFKGFLDLDTIALEDTQNLFARRDIFLSGAILW